jgi:hypothetical protein
MFGCRHTGGICQTGTSISSECSHQCTHPAFLQLLESKGLFTNCTSDEVLVSPVSVGDEDPLHHALGWSFNDSACSLFSSLAADRTFYQHFHSCRTKHPMALETLNGLADADFSSSHTSTYVHSKILPNAYGSIEHINIMYWTDRFHLCESEQEALAYDEAKKCEHRALIWPYFRSVYNDISGFCSSLSLYIFQVGPDPPLHFVCCALAFTLFPVICARHCAGSCGSFSKCSRLRS